MWSELKKLYACREVIWHLTSTELKAAHRHKLLGNLWALLDPLLMMVVLSFVFYNLREYPYEFALYIFSGLIAWDFFARNLLNASTCIRRQQSLIHKVPIPMAVFPMATLLRALNDLLWGLAAFMIMKLFSSAPLETYLHVVWFIPMFLLFCVFTLGLSFLVASLGVFFQDMINILGVVIRLGFFLNPVFWPIDWVPARILNLYYMLNPVGGFLIAFRRSLLAGSSYSFDIPVPHYYLFLSLVSVLSLVVGFSVFHRGRGHYAKYI